MWPGLIALLGFLIFVGIIISLFLVPLIVVGVNVAILYCLFLCIHKEVRKYKRGELYLKAGLLAAIAILIFGNFLPLWWITTLALLSFFIVHVYLFLKNHS